MNILISTRNRVFILLAKPSETRNSQRIYSWLKVGTFQTKFDKTYYFCQHYWPVYDVMQNKIKFSSFFKV